jgi:hypothetical protein
VVSFTPRPIYPHAERVPGTHWIGGWVGPRASLEAALPLSGLETPIIQSEAQRYTTELYRLLLLLLLPIIIIIIIIIITIITIIIIFQIPTR